MSALLEQLQTRYGLPLLDADNYDHFVYGHETVLLFFSNDPVMFPESHDLAVILPELQILAEAIREASPPVRPIRFDLGADSWIPC